MATVMYKCWLIEFILVLLLFLATKNGYSQDPKLGFGLSAGPNLSIYSRRYYTNFPLSDAWTSPGFSVSAAVNYNLSSHFFWNAQFGFVKNTTGFQLVYPDSHFSSKETNSWLSVPIKLNYVFNPARSGKLFAGAGLTTRRLIATKSDSEHSFTGVWEYLGSVQCGVQIRLPSRKSVALELTYLRSLRNEVKAGRDKFVTLYRYGYLEVDRKLNSVSLEVSYLFGH